MTLLYEMEKRNAKKGLATLVHRRRHGHCDVRGTLEHDNGQQLIYLMAELVPAMYVFKLSQN